MSDQLTVLEDARKKTFNRAINQKISDLLLQLNASPFCAEDRNRILTLSASIDELIRQTPEANVVGAVNISSLVISELQNRRRYFIDKVAKNIGLEYCQLVGSTYFTYIFHDGSANLNDQFLVWYDDEIKHDLEHFILSDPRRYAIKHINI